MSHRSISGLCFYVTRSKHDVVWFILFTNKLQNKFKFFSIYFIRISSFIFRIQATSDKRRRIPKRNNVLRYRWRRLLNGHRGHHFLWASLICFRFLSCHCICYSDILPHHAFGSAAAAVALSTTAAPTSHQVENFCQNFFSIRTSLFPTFSQ